MSVGLRLVFVNLFRFGILCFFSGLALTFVLVLFAFVVFCFFSTMPRDWLGRTSPK